LFELAQQGGAPAAAELYAWFLPLLRLDTTTKFVQLIKLAQAQVGLGSEFVRAPRLTLDGAERAEALALIQQANAARPGA
jgi:4-hydroxy-tetrahydrodipicolinate synthase